MRLSFCNFAVFARNVKFGDLAFQDDPAPVQAISPFLLI
jgi:hypothetical protein